MRAAERTVVVLALAVARQGRARFVEEWQADVAAARAVGLSPLEIVVAAARVAGFLGWVRVRERVRRQPDWPELLAVGAGLGFAAVVVDVPLDLFAPVVAPFVLLVAGRRLSRSVLTWITGAA